MSRHYLAAVQFDDGQDVDALFRRFIEAQQSRGLRVSGVLQYRGKDTGDCHCSDMDLEVIGDARVFRISQSLGKGSSGCRLHPGMLAETSAFLECQISDGADLLVLNRFGRGESEGSGFRDLISKALLLEIPTLIAVRAKYLDAWRVFAGEVGVCLPFEVSALESWLTALEQEKAA